jgi:hypothetical protein
MQIYQLEILQALKLKFFINDFNTLSYFRLYLLYYLYHIKKLISISIS